MPPDRPRAARYGPRDRATSTCSSDWSATRCPARSTGGTRRDDLRELVEVRRLGACAGREDRDLVGAQRVHHPQDDVARRLALRQRDRCGTVQRDPRVDDARRARSLARSARAARPCPPSPTDRRAPYRRPSMPPRRLSSPARRRDLDPAALGRCGRTRDLGDEVRTIGDRDVPGDLGVLRELERVGLGVERQGGARILVGRAGATSRCAATRTRSGRRPRRRSRTRAGSRRRTR